MLTETEKAYLAGIVDADGCITITTHKGIRHTLVVVISQANQPFLKHWQEKTGLGGVYFNKKANTTGQGYTNRRDYYQWAMSSGQAEQFLQLVLPYMCIKRRQAEVAQKFRETKSFMSRSGLNRLPDNILMQREQYRQQVRALNRGEEVSSEDIDEPATQQPELFDFGSHREAA